MLACLVRPSLLLGVELPPVPAGAGTPLGGGAVDPGGFPGNAVLAGSHTAAVDTPADLVPWWGAARAAATAGAGVVWFRSAIGAASASCDACTIAAAAVDQVPGVHLGVVSSVPLERHPAVLAREVTALDVVSRGRAAVLLQWAPALPSGSVDGVEQLAEAVAVCDAVLREDTPVFEGRHYHVAGAVNRPPPVQVGGLPVFCDAPAGPAARSTQGTEGLRVRRLVLQSASALVCSDDPSDVAAWKEGIEEATASAPGARGELAPPALVCRTTVREVATGSGGAAAGDDTAERLRAARDAGADGVIVRVPAPWLARAVRGREPTRACQRAPEPSDLGLVLAAHFEAWRR